MKPWVGIFFLFAAMLPVVIEYYNRSSPSPAPPPRADDRLFNRTIFVSIPSYRDVMCMETIRDLFDKASNPNRIFLGICEQNSGAANEWCRPDASSPFDFHRNIRMISIPHREAKGHGYARYLASTLYNKEDYYFSVDAHTKFTQGWDVELIAMHEQTPDPSKAIITHYPLDLEHAENVTESENSIPVMCVLNFDEQTVGLPRFQAIVRPRKAAALRPVPFIAGGMFFTTAAILKEVPWDPNMVYLFQGEEFMYSARTFTSGYMMYTPSKNVIFHNYGRNSEPKLMSSEESENDDYTITMARLTSTLRRILRFEEPPLLDYGPYGLGTVRTLEEYYDFAALDIPHRISHSEEKFCPPSDLLAVNTKSTAASAAKDGFVLTTKEGDILIIAVVALIANTLALIFYISSYLLNGSGDKSRAASKEDAGNPKSGGPSMQRAKLWMTNRSQIIIAIGLAALLLVNLAFTAGMISKIVLSAAGKTPLPAGNEEKSSVRNATAIDKKLSSKAQLNSSSNPLNDTSSLLHYEVYFERVNFFDGVKYEAADLKDSAHLVVPAIGAPGALVMIEPRPGQRIGPVCEQFSSKVPEDWALYVIHGRQNGESSRQAVESIARKKVFMQLNTDNLIVNQYNWLFKTSFLWEAIDAEHILVIQMDTRPCGPQLDMEKFGKFGYIGCRQDDNVHEYLKEWAHYGSGGLSLRRKSFMLECLKRYPNGKGSDWEDVTFSNCVSELRSQDFPAPTRQDVGDFCAQGGWGDTSKPPRSFGAHQLGKNMHDLERKQRFQAYCPNADVLW